MLFQTAIEQFVSSYIETAEWSTSDGEASEMTQEFRQHAYQAAGEFIGRIAGLGLDICNLDESSIFESLPEAIIYDQFPVSGGISQLAHDLWITRQGHGAGFWDGDYLEQYASQLTAIAKDMGEYHGEVCLEGVEV